MDMMIIVILSEKSINIGDVPDYLHA